MLKASDGLAIGALARRTGLAVSAIRFYEEQGLVSATRNAGGQRRFLRSDIRRLSFILIAQKIGFTLGEIRALLEGLPQARTPTDTDWKRISRIFQRKLDERIADLQILREKVDGCIGCGCLSLRKCTLYNRHDKAATLGAGPRYLMGDRHSDAEEAE